MPYGIECGRQTFRRFGVEEAVACENRDYQHGGAPYWAGARLVPGSTLRVSDRPLGLDIASLTAVGSIRQCVGEQDRFFALEYHRFATTWTNRNRG